MFDPKVFIVKIESKYSDREVKELYDYDVNWVLAKAPQKGNGAPFDNLFLVSKGSSVVKAFLPFDDSDKYLRAIHQEPLYSAR